MLNLRPARLVCSRVHRARDIQEWSVRPPNKRLWAYGHRLFREHEKRTVACASAHPSLGPPFLPLGSPGAGCAAVVSLEELGKVVRALDAHGTGDLGQAVACGGQQLGGLGEAAIARCHEGLTPKVALKQRRHSRSLTPAAAIWDTEISSPYMLRECDCRLD